MLITVSVGKYYIRKLITYDKITKCGNNCFEAIDKGVL